MASDKLVPVRMKKEDMQRSDVQVFRCGSEPYETPLAEWIKVHSAERIASGNKIWLYRQRAADGPLVGYGSLARGEVETAETDGSKRMVRCMEIPMLALHEDFWGRPIGITDPEDRYSCQLIRHLQEQARIGQKNGKGIERLLALYVHPCAIRAQKLYRRCGFEVAPGRFLPDFETDTELLGMDYVWRED